MPSQPCHSTKSREKKTNSVWLKGRQCKALQFSPYNLDHQNESIYIYINICTHTVQTHTVPVKGTLVCRSCVLLVVGLYNQYLGV